MNITTVTLFLFYSTRNEIKTIIKWLYINVVNYYLIATIIEVSTKTKVITYPV